MLIERKMLHTQQHVSRAFLSRCVVYRLYVHGIQGDEELCDAPLQPLYKGEGRALPAATGFRLCHQAAAKLLAVRLWRCHSEAAASLAVESPM